jgi:hypothetical protein
MCMALVIVPFRRLKTVDARGCVLLGNETLRSIVENHRLAALSFSRCGGLTDQGVAYVAQRCPLADQPLSCLTLSCCSGLTSLSIPHLAALSQLESLDLTGTAVQCTMDVLGIAGRGMCALHTLNLTGWRVVGCAAVLQQFPRLRELVMDGAAQCFPEPHVDPRHAAPPDLPCLTALSLQWAVPSASAAALAALLAGCTNVTRLALCGAECLTDDLLELIARQLHHLRILELQRVDGITDAGIRHLTGLPHLRTLDLMGCSRVAALEKAGFQHMRTLEVLNVGGLDGATDPLSFVPIVNLMSTWGRVQTLLLSANQQVTNDFITQLLSPPSTRTDAGYRTAATTSTSLETLDISMCWRLDDGVVDVLSSVTSLTHLDISGTLLSPEGAATIARRLSRCCVKLY